MKKNYKIDSKYSEVNELIDNLRGNNFYDGMAEKLKGEIEICLVEALNNVVRHSYKEEEGSPIELELNISDGFLDILITEYGCPRPDMRKPELNFDPEDIENLPEGGMGLFLIEQIMDFNEYKSENGRNTFLMKKKLA